MAINDIESSRSENIPVQDRLPFDVVIIVSCSNLQGLEDQKIELQEEGSVKRRCSRSRSIDFDR